MHIRSLRHACIIGTSLAALAAAPAFAEEVGAESVAGVEADAIIVTGARTTYNNAVLTDFLIDDRSPVSSVVDLINTLPGVQVNQGDPYGFDDWSTTISIRGFQSAGGEQQIGSTIDGIPAGDSGYGGGAKANRYVDTQNIGTVQVSQGTADIASRSNEALGGTVNYVTSDPIDELRVRLSASFGDAQAQRYYGRLDTGLFANGMAKAWISYSHQQATDWINQSAQNRRDHVAAKFILDTPVRVTGYASYDDAHEDNYDTIYSAEQFALDPTNDGLTADWTGIPYQDQAYRRAWSTLRENFLAYLKAETMIADAIDLKLGGYYHDMSGRGDWVPQYVVNVAADGAGRPQSELNGTSTVNGGAAGDFIYFVDAQGVALSPRAGCVGNIGFPYGGTRDPNYDPRCYAAGAIGAQSYRHTHYGRKRYGGTADAAWTVDFGRGTNTLRGGLWYEDINRREWRDWHNVIDTSVGPDFAEMPYWTQYSRRYPQDTFKWYLQDQVEFGPVTANFGAQQFTNHIDREDLFGETPNVSVKSRSKVLFSGGVQVEPMPNLNIFGGYAENFRALTDALLEFGDEAFVDIEPETATNWEAGVRYTSPMFQGSATWFKSKFSNRVIFVPNSTEAGQDYLGEGDGTFFNGGGIDSEGFELLANVRPFEGLTLYGSYTYTDATYRGTGNAVLDDEQGITPGNRVAGIPKHMWVASGSYSSGPVTFGITGKYTGNRAVNVSNEWVADNFFITDFNLSLRGEALSELLEQVTLSLNVTNVTDESYLGGIAGNAAWLGAPRTAIFSVTADF
jgi:iron complex outermembrane receptor protein